jgi:hypothetical protein
MMAWYGGYHFGQQMVFCARDVINYMDDLLESSTLAPRSYWVSKSNIVGRLLNKSDEPARAEVELLTSGGQIIKAIQDNVKYSEMDDSLENLWSALFMSGYLTSTDTVAEGLVLQIQNKDVLTVFQESITEWNEKCVRQSTVTIADFFAAALEGETGKATQYVRALLERMIFVEEGVTEEYQNILLGLLRMNKGWTVLNKQKGTEQVSGIISARRSLGVEGFLMAVKHAANDQDLRQVSEQALAELQASTYVDDLHALGVAQHWVYGLAFHGKNCVVHGKLATRKFVSES